MRHIMVNKKHMADRAKSETKQTPVCQAAEHRKAGALPYMARTMCGCFYCKADLKKKSSMNMKAVRLSDVHTRPTIREMRRVTPTSLKQHNSITDMLAQVKES